eukprot:GHVL01035748.1.p1 GENE.GHVL01035748.1~~GHVL01035748.1.p1  ORF type:complete len:842 (-),score=214.02 GHVL01035748.1:234-2759(-)
MDADETTILISSSSCSDAFETCEPFLNVLSKHLKNVEKLESTAIERFRSIKSSILDELVELNSSQIEDYQKSRNNVSSDNIASTKADVDVNNTTDEVKKFEVDGEEKIEVKGDEKIEVEGDEKIEVEGDEKIDVEGEENFEVVGEEKTEVEGEEEVFDKKVTSKDHGSQFNSDMDLTHPQRQNYLHSAPNHTDNNSSKLSETIDDKDGVKEQKADKTHAAHPMEKTQDGISHLHHKRDDKKKSKDKMTLGDTSDSTSRPDEESDKSDNTSMSEEDKESDKFEETAEHHDITDKIVTNYVNSSVEEDDKLGSKRHDERLNDERLAKVVDDSAAEYPNSENQKYSKNHLSSDKNESNRSNDSEEVAKQKVANNFDDVKLHQNDVEEEYNEDSLVSHEAAQTDLGNKINEADDKNLINSYNKSNAHSHVKSEQSEKHQSSDKAVLPTLHDNRMASGNPDVLDRITQIGHDPKTGEEDVERVDLRQNHESNAHVKHLSVQPLDSFDDGEGIVFLNIGSRVMGQDNVSVIVPSTAEAAFIQLENPHVKHRINKKKKHSVKSVEIPKITTAHDPDSQFLNKTVDSLSVSNRPSPRLITHSKTSQSQDGEENVNKKKSESEQPQNSNILKEEENKKNKKITVVEGKKTNKKSTGSLSEEEADSKAAISKSFLCDTLMGDLSFNRMVKFLRKWSAITEDRLRRIKLHAVDERFIVMVDQPLESILHNLAKYVETKSVESFAQNDETNLMNKNSELPTESSGLFLQNPQAADSSKHDLTSSTVVDDDVENHEETANKVQFGDGGKSVVGESPHIVLTKEWIEDTRRVSLASKESSAICFLVAILILSVNI